MQTDTDQVQGQQAGAQVSGRHLQPPGKGDVLGASDQVQVVSYHLGMGKWSVGECHCLIVQTSEVLEDD